MGLRDFIQRKKKIPRLEEINITSKTKEEAATKILDIIEKLKNSDVETIKTIISLVPANEEEIVAEIIRQSETRNVNTQQVVKAVMKIAENDGKDGVIQDSIKAVRDTKGVGIEEVAGLIGNLDDEKIKIEETYTELERIYSKALNGLMNPEDVIDKIKLLQAEKIDERTSEIINKIMNYESKRVMEDKNISNQDLKNIINGWKSISNGNYPEIEEAIKQIVTEKIKDIGKIEEMDSGEIISYIKQWEQYVDDKDDETLKDSIETIVAKKLSHEIKESGGVRLFAFTKELIPPEEMIRRNFIEKIEEEYNHNNENEKMRDRIKVLDKKMLKHRILEEIIKQQIVPNYKTTNIYTIPEMNNLEQEDVEYLIDQIEKLNSEKLTEDEKEDISYQVYNGNEVDSEIQSKLNENLSQLSRRDKQYLAECDSNKLRKTISILREEEKNKPKAEETVDNSINTNKGIEEK